MPTTFVTAFGALRRNKMRSALSALGVIIAVGAVIAMMEIGQGSKTALQKTIASMGANNLLVLPGAAASGGISWGVGTTLTLTPQDADEIVAQCPAVGAVAPDRPGPLPSGLWQSQLDPGQICGHHAPPISPSATGKPWTRATCSATATSQPQQGLPDRRDLAAGTVPRANLPLARKSASRTCRFG